MLFQWLLSFILCLLYKDRSNFIGSCVDNLVDLDTLPAGDIRETNGVKWTPKGN